MASTHITRAVSAEDLLDLLTQSRSAVVAWNRDGAVAAEPAAFRFAAGSYLVGLARDILTDGTEVAVLVDDGEMYFDLRGVRVRGRATATATATREAEAEAEGNGLDWFEVRPEREVAWHYGTLRER